MGKSRLIFRDINLVSKVSFIRHEHIKVMNHRRPGVLGHGIHNVDFSDIVVIGEVVILVILHLLS